MPPNFIALAIPFFFLCIGAELLVAWRRHRRVYRFADAIIGQQLDVIFGKTGG